MTLKLCKVGGPFTLTGLGSDLTSLTTEELKAKYTIIMHGTNDPGAAESEAIYQYVIAGGTSSLTYDEFSHVFYSLKKGS